MWTLYKLVQLHSICQGFVFNNKTYGTTGKYGSPSSLAVVNKSHGVQTAHWPTIETWDCRDESKDYQKCGYASERHMKDTAHLSCWEALGRSQQWKSQRLLGLCWQWWCQASRCMGWCGLCCTVTHIILELSPRTLLVWVACSSGRLYLILKSLCKPWMI